jgi:hypothetical protein
MNAYFRQAALKGECSGEAALPIFEGCRRLARVLLSVKWKDLAKEILGSALDSTCFANGTSVFEFQPLSVRRDVMRAIWIVIKDWPDRLVSAMRIAAVPRYAFDHEKHDTPLWMQYGLARISPARPRLLHREEVYEMCAWLVRQDHVASKHVVANAFGIGPWCFEQVAFHGAVKRFNRVHVHLQ